MKPTERQIKEEAHKHGMSPDIMSTFFHSRCRAFEEGAKWAISQMENQWISISERLPERDVDVIWLDKEGDTVIDWIGDGKYAENFYLKTYTHWCPITSPPNTEVK